METKAKDSRLIEKTQALCEAIVEQADFQTLKQQLDAFMGDELLKFQYQQVNDLAQLLQMKQGNGVDLKPEEIAQFEKMRDEIMGNPVARGFMDAQDQLQQLHEMVGRFLNMTFQLGRRPEYDDVFDGSCGGCGCH